MTELRPIPDHPDYLCGADGSVWSTKNGSVKRMRVFVRDRTGHLGVNLSEHGKYRLHSAHKLIALAWIGPQPTPVHVVMHKDDDPANNVLANLEWGLPRDNSAQMVARGRQARGERCARSKLTAAVVADIRDRICRGEVQRDIALALGITASNVSDIKRGRTWRAD